MSLIRVSLLYFYRLHHPNIVELLEVHEEKTKVYLVMELWVTYKKLRIAAKTMIINMQQSQCFFHQSSTIIIIIIIASCLLLLHLIFCSFVFVFCSFFDLKCICDLITHHCLLLLLLYSHTVQHIGFLKSNSWFFYSVDQHIISYIHCIFSKFFNPILIVYFYSFKFSHEPQPQRVLKRPLEPFSPHT